ncbi:MAG: hypothetical protein U1D41_05605 [Nitrosomonas sp.]|jgi:hypothetical protein|uniref:hypothetical protein n=1 Tax=Nitrosomonas sp. TaxID=42353 RepID=UPI00273155F3|nr:hypothetical protein [Nitrosomonas sp.]MDP1548688.1 hypothetical protein [Nitrosomonas sp.]MDP1935426.1 hypothetical protein [Nitrosomonas sp.]MDP3663687.1 hypothetical protein [Nitrosomonas sp.]MDZ4105631.1 hypothetical protein [Nitrosomonas sp.]
MDLDKIYVLQTGVSLKISTIALQELIANAISKQKFPELEKIRSTSDLYAYLSVVVCEGAEDLISRRQRWIDQKIKTDLIAGHPVSFRSFCNLFWRNLDEDDPDGDEWQKMIASDQFYFQLTILLNKLRIAERSLQNSKGVLPEFSLSSA